VAALFYSLVESAKLNGVPIHQVMTMGAQGQPGAAGAGTPPPQQQPEQRQAEAPAPTPSGAIGGALGRLGGFGGLRRKKQQEPPTEPAPQQQAQAAPQQSAPAAGVLMEMTSDMSGFSNAPVDASKFEVPAGFKQVQSR
jgi:hypothetical protein